MRIILWAVTKIALIRSASFSPKFTRCYLASWLCPDLLR